MARDRRPQLSDLDVEIPMGFAQVGLRLARCIATVALVLFLTLKVMLKPWMFPGATSVRRQRCAGK